MFISKKKHAEVVDAYEKTIAALRLELTEGQQTLETALAAADVALRNANAETAAADAALARYVTDYAPRALEPLP